MTTDWYMTISSPTNPKRQQAQPFPKLEMSGSSTHLLPLNYDRDEFWALTTASSQLPVFHERIRAVISGLNCGRLGFAFTEDSVWVSLISRRHEPVSTFRQGCRSSRESLTHGSSSTRGLVCGLDISLWSSINNLYWSNVIANILSLGSISRASFRSGSGPYVFSLSRRL